MAQEHADTTRQRGQDEPARFSQRRRGPHLVLRRGCADRPSVIGLIKEHLVVEKEVRPAHLTALSNRVLEFLYGSRDDSECTSVQTKAGARPSQLFLDLQALAAVVALTFALITVMPLLAAP